MSADDPSFAAALAEGKAKAAAKTEADAAAAAEDAAQRKAATEALNAEVAARKAERAEAAPRDDEPPPMVPGDAETDKKYLESHGVGAALSAALGRVVRERPDLPLRFIASLLAPESHTYDAMYVASASTAAAPSAEDESSKLAAEADAAAPEGAPAA